MPEIIVKLGDSIVQKNIFVKESIRIGRVPDNEIIVENLGVSRYHAVIDCEDGRYLLTDLDSSNGTFVNGVRIKKTELQDRDVITIGKYTLEFHSEADKPEHVDQMDGTMILKTKQQKELLDGDRQQRELVNRIGGSALIGLENTGLAEYRIDREVTTLGKAKFVHIRAKGFLLSGIQAKIVKEGENFFLMNLGRKGKTLLNGEPVTRAQLKNGDILQVGKSTFRFIEDK